MYRNNACALPTTSGEWLWRVEFTVRVEHLEQALGCDYRSVIRYRKELADAGRLKYQKAVKGRHPGIYTMIPFVKTWALSPAKTWAAGRHWFMIMWAACTTPLSSKTAKTEE